MMTIRSAISKLVVLVCALVFVARYEAYGQLPQYLINDFGCTDGNHSDKWCIDFFPIQAGSPCPLTCISEGGSYWICIDTATWLHVDNGYDAVSLNHAESYNSGNTFRLRQSSLSLRCTKSYECTCFPTGQGWLCGEDPTTWLVHYLKVVETDGPCAEN